MQKPGHFPESHRSKTIKAPPLPTDLTKLCPSVHSRIVLTNAQRRDERDDQYVFRHCSNLDNCYNRPDFSEDIPECLLHVVHTIY